MFSLIPDGKKKQKVSELSSSLATTSSDYEEFKGEKNTPPSSVTPTEMVRASLSVSSSNTSDEKSKSDSYTLNSSNKSTWPTELPQSLKNNLSERGHVLWEMIGNYLAITNNPGLEKEKFSLLEAALKEALKDADELSPVDPANPEFLRHVYLSNNEKLIALFMKLFPIPKSDLFKGNVTPEFIHQKEQESTAYIVKCLKSNQKDIIPVENEVIKIQRLFRSKKRHKEEVERIKKHYKHARLKTPSESLLEDANKPYYPQKCDRKLAARIFHAAKKVRLFSMIRHLTSADHLVSILNDGLYGRRTLLKFNLPFVPAALGSCDIDDGDQNVICFAPNDIDPDSRGSIAITLDLDKIQSRNPCIFYKQRDFGYALKKTRSVSIGQEELLFSHTGSFRCSDFKCMNLQLFDREGRPYAFSQLPKPSFIAYEFSRIHQILTLNFFRFIDNILDTNLKRNEALTNDIYSKINALDAAELEKFLLALGTQMTDTAEFNFYGAHLIDFSSVLKIECTVALGHHYILNLSEFISASQAGDMNPLINALKYIPALFKSYRFVDYLLANISHPLIKKELQKYRGDCSVPFWKAVIEQPPAKPSEITTVKLP